MLPVKKIYIDSKARTNDSKSTTNFSIDLIESLPMPEDATFIVADIIIPHTWYLIAPDQNRSLYVKEDLGGGQSGQYLYELEIPAVSYDGPSLESAISNALNHATPALQFTYTVHWNPVTETINIIPDSSVNGSPKIFRILTDNDVNTAFVSNFEKQAPSQINALLGNVGTSKENTVTSHYQSQRVDFNKIKYLFLKSPNLGTFRTLGSFGERTVIKKIPVTAGPGQMILDDVRSGMDTLDCSKQSLKRLEFQLTDERGNEVDLHHHDISFSLIFNIQAPQ